MNLKIYESNFFYITIISLYAYVINWMSGNLGVMPIDTFSFFDTGFSILKNKYPIRDFWIFSGIFIDYLQALFFLLLGVSWSSYIAHASFFNILISLVVYLTFTNLNLSKFYSFFYAISVATLCYPVAGTPFAYQHSFILSLVSILIICLAIKKKSNILWFVLPIIMSLAFLSQQTPSSYINVILIFVTLYYFISEKNFNNLKYFIIGSLTISVSFFIFLIISKTPLTDFIYQYILFPLTIGSARVLNEQSAYVSLTDQLNLKRLFNEFKFIHVFLILLFIITLNGIINKSKKLENYFIFTNLLLFVSSLCFIFHQLITANQIFIFALIPILAGFLHINLNRSYTKYYFKIFIILIVALSTIKYHYRFNLDRKFMDLEKVNLEKAVPASELSPKLKNLKWITPLNYSQNPQEELDFLKKVIKHLKQDTREKTVITHYQFFSVVLNQDLNILNRWYLDHNTHPTENHKYFDYYQKLVNKNLKKNNVEIIYLVSFVENEMIFDKIKIYFPELCFENNTIIKNKFSSHKIKDCS